MVERVENFANKISEPVKAMEDTTVLGATLKTALGLSQTTEDSIVLEHLRNAVSRVFTVLQSLLNNRADKGILEMSSEFVSCIALFLYVQGLESKESMGDWQPLHVQERSARCTAPTWHMKRYVSSEQLGDDDKTPLLGFPRCCKHLTHDL